MWWVRMWWVRNERVREGKEVGDFCGWKRAQRWSLLCRWCRHRVRSPPRPCGAQDPIVK